MDEKRKIFSCMYDKSVMAFIKAIPSDWLCIDAELHAPETWIEEDRVAKGFIFLGRGKTNPDSPGNGITVFSTAFCKYYDNNSHCFHKLKQPSCLEPSLEIPGALKFVDIQTDDPADIILGKKEPCGLFLRHAGLLTARKNLDPLKDLLIRFVEKGYIASNIQAIRSIKYTIDLFPEQQYLLSSGGLSELENGRGFPRQSVNEYTYFMLHQHPKESDSNRNCFIGISWQPELGGNEENLSTLVKKIEEQQELKEIPV